MRKGRQTGFLTRFDPWGNEIEEKIQGDMSKPRKTTKLNGKALRLPCIGFSWTDHKKRHDILESKNACHHCSHDSDLRKMKRLYINDSLHHGKLQEQFSKMLGICSSIIISSRDIGEVARNCNG